MDGRLRVDVAVSRLPDDGHRYEIVDGVLLVNAAPVPKHQGVVLELAMLLRNASPDDLLVLVAPLDVVLAEDTVVEPDVLVARRSDFSEKNLSAIPLLAAEVLSPSTRDVDLNLKKDRYERAGVPSYWVVDPHGLTLTAHQMVDDACAVAAEVGPGDRWTAKQPFSVTVTPGGLRR